MKCFKFLFIIFFSLSLYAQENFVIPKYNNTFTNGDRATLLIESPLSDEELKSFENSKITDVIYVFSFHVDGGEREFEVIFSDPPKNQKEKKERPFKAKGINYTFDKERAGDNFVLFESDFNRQLSTKFLKPILFSFLGILLLVLTFNILTRYRELRERKNLNKNRALDLIQKIENAKTRNDFEAIFADRKLVEEYVEINQIAWKKFQDAVFEIQYQPAWTESDAERIKSLARKLRDLRPKHGI